ncbi:GGDEF domain-containing protein [Clostridium akagii]|uniref:GGDEF domain-containing protein n=1 Tax=Clostridium akagii TaxID=91623 RepID=UPI00047B7E5B|nr:diguanylate cyclase [Clostridium akagii]
MIFNLFINLCVLITFISIAHFYFRDKDVRQNKSVLIKIINGVCSGSLGILLMVFSMHITPTVLIDFRVIPIILSSLYGGLLPTIIASLITGNFRILYFGISRGSVFAVIVILLMAIGCTVINLIKTQRKNKLVYNIIFAIILNSIKMIILINNPKLLAEGLIVYCFGLLFVSYFMFKFTEYLSESVKLHKRLENQATVDFLTGLNNVREFNTSLNNIEQQAIRKGESISMIYLDIDYFKKINDVYGHIAGDIVLKKLADILTNTCRSFDIISRNGGEEFSVILLDCSSIYAFTIAERLRKKVEGNQFNISNEVSIHITISIGVATYPDTTDNVNKLTNYADIALYEAKRNGRNKVVVYNNNKVMPKFQLEQFL